VDVTPYLEAFETSNRVTVDGYSYLQGEGSGSAPSPIVRRQPSKRPALLPLFIAVGVLVVGLYLMKLFLDIQRIVPPQGRAPGAAASATPSSENIVAPRAIPVEETPSTEAAAIASSAPLATATEPEVRRAEPPRALVRRAEPRQAAGRGPRATPRSRRTPTIRTSARPMPSAMPRTTRTASAARWARTLAAPIRAMRC